MGGAEKSAVFLLGGRLDLLAVLQPFDRSVGVKHLAGQHNLLALLHRVAGLQALQEGCGEERRFDTAAIIYTSDSPKKNKKKVPFNAF